jgi:DNA primase
MSTPIEEIKARLDIVDIVSETVQLRKSGNSYSGLCPFHHNTRTPSFVVWPDSGTWRCFGACAEGGDIFKYVMKREGWDFPEALKFLADKAGVQLVPQTPQQVERQEEHERLRTLLEEAATYFHNLLMKNPAGQKALAYLRGRHLSDETLAAWELGYALPGWDNTITYFKEKGYSEDDLKDAGLVSVNDQGRMYDRFRNRVIFPIRDDRGRMAGFGARALEPEDNPKYLNSPQSVLFDKSSLLYGLDKAKRAIRAEDRAVIVEGYMDVIAPAQAGFTNLISPMGTALTPQQIRLLKRLTRNLVLALDADEAGMKATLRGLDVARDTLDREADPIFNAAGLVRHEGRLQANIRISTLPEGMDPDELVNQDPDAWAVLISKAKPVVIHVMDSLAAGQDLDDPKVKSDIAEQVLPLIADVPNAIERDTYTQQLARLLRVDERALLQTRAARRPSQVQRRRPPGDPRQPAEAPEETPHKARGTLSMVQAAQRHEEQILSIIMRHPELLYRVDRALQQAGLERVSSQDFQSTSHQELFRSTLESINQDLLEPLNFALEVLPLPLLEMADEILLKSETVDPRHAKVLEDLMRSLLQLRERSLNQSIDQIRFLIEEAQKEGYQEARPYMETMGKYTVNLNRIQQAIGKHTNRSVGAH